MKKILCAALLSFVGTQLRAEGLPCWALCHCPRKIVSAADVPNALRLLPNRPLGFFARSTGILTTYLGKILGIQGWRDYHQKATVKGRVVQAAGSTDFLYTIDLQIEQLRLKGQQVALPQHPTFIRIEVFPFVRIGSPLPVAKGEEVCISGKLMWDGDGFLEIHPKKSRDFLGSACQ